MPLYPIKYQPYFLDPDSPNHLACAGQYLYPVKPSDIIYWQGYQTPCGINLVYDPTFLDQSLGTELVSNGAFAGSLAPWTYSPSWSWISLPAAYYTQDPSGGDIYQAIGISTGTLYQVQFTILGNTNGGFINVYLGDTLIASVSDVLDHTVTGVYASGSAEIRFEIPAGSPAITCILYNVSVKEVTQTFWEGNGEWSFNNGFACSTVLGTADLENIGSDYITNGKRYRVTFTISGSTSGTVTPKVGGTPSAAQTGNGIKTVWINATGNGLLTFSKSAFFDGCISDIDVREMKKASDFTWQFIADAGNGAITNLVNYVRLYEDNVTLIFDPVLDILPEDCYILRIFDTCTVQYDDAVLNGSFAGGTASSVPEWVENNPGPANQYDFTGNQAEFSFTNTGIPFEVYNPSLANTPNPLLVDGNYQVTFDIISNTDPTNIGINVRPRGSTLPAFYSTVGTHTYTISNYAPNNTAIRAIVILANFKLAGTNTSGAIVIDNVKVFRVAPFTATYQSEPISYKWDQPNTKLVRAYCDKNNLGFEFENTNFFLQQRILIRSLNPSYPSQVGISKSGNGNANLYYSEVEKYWLLVTDWMDESAHDSFNLQIKMDHLLIGETIETMKEYVTDGEEYSPAWNTDGSFSLAEGSVRIRIKDDGQKFNRHY